ncbi:MAG: hypothetical protein GXZ01_04645 [Clostridiaceae bacterium]|jgi:hypothetical protein|nr:hypothetical protein [Clostridiaceae bacterium]
MAYALVLASEKSTDNGGNRLFRKTGGWFRGFRSAPVQASYIEIDKNLILYIITIPRPEIFHSLNRTGKRRTLGKWASVLNRNIIDHYLAEETLRDYITGEWSMNNSGFLSESIRKNMYLLFSAEPLRRIEMRTMTITLSGARKEYIRPKLVHVLKNFKIVNVIDANSGMQEMWDEFMAETGVPVCITEDFGVLSRSHVWISYEETGIDYPFSGIKVDAGSKCIIYPGGSRQYRIGYSLGKKLMSKLGTKTVQRFNNLELTEFLLDMVVNSMDVSLAEAEEILGLKISIISVESQSQCS